MVLRGFEQRLEKLVEGTFARMFKAGLNPIEIGQRIARAMDAERTTGARGRRVVPNDFVVAVSEEDWARFITVEETLLSELTAAARDHARDEGYQLVGPIQVLFVVEERLTTGQFDVAATFVPFAGGAGPGTLVSGTGQRLTLGIDPTTVGRLDDCELTIDDTNVSRRHAEIRPTAEGWIVTDLNSTNGTAVNGQSVREHQLVDGDEITFGSVSVTFEGT